MTSLSKIQLLFSGIILVILCAAKSHSFAADAVSPGSIPNILILGDSLSAAYGIPIAQSWPRLLATNIRLHYPDASVNNASINGETTFGGAQRLPGLLERFEPNILIIELGGNDGLRGFKFSQTTDNLNSMVALALQNDIKVLLIGVDLPPNLGPVYNQQFQQIFTSVVHRHSIHYLPRFLQGIAADEPHLMQADGIHPTVMAQPILAEKVLAALSALLQD